jgi:hypothetical protein
MPLSPHILFCHQKMRAPPKIAHMYVYNGILFCHQINIWRRHMQDMRAPPKIAHIYVIYVCVHGILFLPPNKYMEATYDICKICERHQKFLRMCVCACVRGILFCHQSDSVSVWVNQRAGARAHRKHTQKSRCEIKFCHDFQRLRLLPLKWHPIRKKNKWRKRDVVLSNKSIEQWA